MRLDRGVKEQGRSESGVMMIMNESRIEQDAHLIFGPDARAKEKDFKK